MIIFYLFRKGSSVAKYQLKRVLNSDKWFNEINNQSIKAAKPNFNYQENNKNLLCLKKIKKYINYFKIIFVLFGDFLDDNKTRFATDKTKTKTKRILSLKVIWLTRRKVHIRVTITNL